MNKLKNSVCYLSGPMDFAPDDGILWRQSIRLNTQNIGIEWLDPTNKPNGMIREIKDNKQHIKTLKEQGKFNEVVTLAKQIRRCDLRMVDTCDFVILYVDTSVHMCGSYDEAITAERQKKPVLAIIKNGKKTAPLWLFGMVKLEEMFDTVIECSDYLQDLDAGRIDMDDRWVLVNTLVPNINS